MIWFCQHFIRLVNCVSALHELEIIGLKCFDENTNNTVVGIILAELHSLLYKSLILAVSFTHTQMRHVLSSVKGGQCGLSRVRIRQLLCVYTLTVSQQYFLTAVGHRSAENK